MNGSLRYSAIVPFATSDRDAAERIDAVSADVREYGGGEVLAFPYGGAETARSFAAAANAEAQTAGGDILIFVRDARPRSSGWLARLVGAAERTDTGAVGPRLLSAGVEETGLLLRPARFNQFGFAVEALRGLTSRAECDALRSACIVTPRALFGELGGFEETFDELEALDYCLRVRQSGRRVLVDAGATFECSPREATPAAARRARAARYALAERWREAAAPRDNVWPDRTKNTIRRDEMLELGFAREFLATPDITVLVHGAAPVDPDAFRQTLFRTPFDVRAVIWACAGPLPSGEQRAEDAMTAALRATERRGDGYVAFVRGDTELGANWLGELIDAIEYAPDTIAATVVPAGEPLAGATPRSADARCTLVAPRLVPQHVRLRAELPLNDALGDWIAAAVVAGRDTRRVRFSHTSVGAPDADAGFAALWGEPLETYRRADPLALASAVREREAPFASIVTLSYNAPQFTELAVASIHEHTKVPYEIIVVDNGSGPDTVARLGKLPNVRVIYNAKNTGFAYGCNQGIAAARGTHVVLLNNDVIVSDGWLEALIDVQVRNPTVRLSAPRSNNVTGIQQIPNVPYRSIPAMHAFAKQRSIERRGRGFRFVRAIGFCMCVDRRVFDEIGGLDPRYGIGNFEDDDFCIRVRAAGYDIAICDDSFIHHFGQASFIANKVDYRALSQHNRAIFARRWNVELPPGATFDARPIIRRGFDRATDFVPLPPPAGVGADWIAPG